ncbi:MAG: hypothetical protein AAGF97_00370 [Planctomycetota bacterium]
MRFFSVVLVLLAFGSGGSPLKAQQRPIGPSQRIDLKTQLETGLRARRPQEFAFIDEVVKLVDEGKLTRKLVQETFDWARKKRVTYPYVYFERAMQIRAAKVGVQLQGTFKTERPPPPRGPSRTPNRP